MRDYKTTNNRQSLLPPVLHIPTNWATSHARCRFLCRPKKLKVRIMQIYGIKTDLFKIGQRWLNSINRVIIKTFPSSLRPGKEPPPVSLTISLEATLRPDLLPEAVAWGRQRLVQFVPERSFVNHIIHWLSTKSSYWVRIWKFTTFTLQQPPSLRRWYGRSLVVLNCKWKFNKLLRKGIIQPRRR